MAETGSKLFRDQTGQEILEEMKKQSGYQQNFLGSLAGLNTADKTSLIAAVNEVLGKLGTVSGLKTGAKGDAVSAINEIYDFAKVLQESSGAGLHNLYRGKNIGTSFTAAQSVAVRAGTFDDVWVGDYWPMTVPSYKWTDTGGTEHTESSASVTFRIGGCNYYLGTGDQGNGLQSNHLVVIPDNILYQARMNAENTTEGGYVGSEMYTNNLLRAKALIAAAFGSDHILTHREYLQNAVTDGRPSGGAWLNSTVELMTEQMVYGGKVFGVASDGGDTVLNLYTVSKARLPLFVFRPDLASTRSGWYWLRDVVNGACFCGVSGHGYADCNAASNSGGGVRPAFLIY